MARALAVDVVFENHAGSREVKKRREETRSTNGWRQCEHIHMEECVSSGRGGP